MSGIHRSSPQRSFAARAPGWLTVSIAIGCGGSPAGTGQPMQSNAAGMQATAGSTSQNPSGASGAPNAASSAGSRGQTSNAQPSGAAGTFGSTAPGDAGTSKPSGGAAGSPAASDAGAMLLADAAPSAATLDDTKTLVPHASWTCGKPMGMPGPKYGTLAFDVELTLGEIYDIGQTQYGHRQLAEIKGGTVKGPKINAQVMDRGLDWQLTLDNGAIELEQVNIFQTDDGGAVYVRTCGAAPSPDGDVRIVLDMEAPQGGAYAWLNTGDFVGTRKLDVAKKTLSLTLYDMTGVVPQGDSVQVSEPSSVPDQTWDCKQAKGSEGAIVYMESVGIGAGSVAVGASKRGTRNIIPITGGTTSGRIQGDVLSGGADYQLLSDAFYLDARYTLHTHDGELVIVRNCGPVGGLVPVFEARVGGNYDWLNANTWLSSDPGVGAGVVNLTIYEAQ